MSGTSAVIVYERGKKKEREREPVASVITVMLRRGFRLLYAFPFPRALVPPFLSSRGRFVLFRVFGEIIGRERKERQN